jgi:hypothetical protein
LTLSQADLKKNSYFFLVILAALPHFQLHRPSPGPVAIVFKKVTESISKEMADDIMSAWLFPTSFL